MSKLTEISEYDLSDLSKKIHDYIIKEYGYVTHSWWDRLLMRLGLKDPFTMTVNDMVVIAFVTQAVICHLFGKFREECPNEWLDIVTMQKENGMLSCLDMDALHQIVISNSVEYTEDTDLDQEFTA